MIALTRALIPVLERDDSPFVATVGSEAGLRGSQAGLVRTSARRAVVSFSKHSAVVYQLKGVR